MKSEEKTLTPGHKAEGKKLMIRIWISKDGSISIESAFREKDFIVNLLTDSLDIAKNLKDNVVNVTPGQLKQRLKQFFRSKTNNRTKGHS